MSPAEIVHKLDCCSCRAVANLVGQAHLAIHINCDPRPRIANTIRSGLSAFYALVFGVGELPDLVILDALCVHIAH